MAQIFDCSDSSGLLSGTRTARQALSRGELVVLPTDTVYGVAADAFTPEAVEKLLAAKGRGRTSPPPVLIADAATLGALAAEVTPAVSALVDAFWPGPLTVIVAAQPSLQWDLGDTGGTVALRIPDHELALELLRETGPLAVSSANTTGEPAARSASEAQAMLTDTVAVYLDAGEVTGEGTASTIIDATGLRGDGGVLRILRDGGVDRAALQDVLPNATVLGVGEDPPDTDTDTDADTDTDSDAAADAVVGNTAEETAEADTSAGDGTGDAGPPQTEG